MLKLWDELFLEQRNNRQIHDQIKTAEDEQWMLMSIEECLKGISERKLKFKDGREVEMKAQKVYGDQMTIFIPSTCFEELKIGDKSAKNSKNYLYLDSSQSIVFSLNLLEPELDNVLMEELFKIMEIEAGRLRPEMKLINEVEFESNNHNVICYEALFLADPTPFYQIVFLTSWKSRALTGSFQYKLEDAPLWYPMSYAMIRSIQW